MSQLGAEYLEKIKQRNLAYEEIRTQVIQYILKKDIKDYNISTDLFIVGFLFEARRQGEVLNEKDICILLGEDDEQFEEDSGYLDTFVLDYTNFDMSLEELLDATVDKNN